MTLIYLRIELDRADVIPAVDLDLLAGADTDDMTWVRCSVSAPVWWRTLDMLAFTGSRYSYESGSNSFTNTRRREERCSYHQPPLELSL